MDVRLVKQLRDLTKEMEGLHKRYYLSPEGNYSHIITHFYISIENMKVQTELKIQQIDDPLIREAIRLHYIDGRSWEMTAMILEYASPDALRKKVERRIKKL